MKWLTLILLLVAGCATRPAPPLPPGAKRATASASSEVPAPAPLVRTLVWDDCGAQPPATYYKVYERTPLNAPWTVYATTFDRFTSITLTGAMRFFTVSACNGEVEVFAGEPCQ